MITAYGIDCTGCTGITKSGTVPMEGRTIATDQNVIAPGTIVMIDGSEYVAEDTGGAIKGNRIDMFYGTEQKANDEWGVKHLEVFIKEGN